MLISAFASVIGSGIRLAVTTMGSRTIFCVLSAEAVFSFAAVVFESAGSVLSYAAGS